MKVVSAPITRKELRDMATKNFGNLVKAVVDVQKQFMAIDASLHADEEALLLSEGSKQENLWGINLYPDLKGEDFIEFDSMINIRPHKKNKSRGVDDPAVQAQIRKVVSRLVK